MPEEPVDRSHPPRDAAPTRIIFWVLATLLVLSLAANAVGYLYARSVRDASGTAISGALAFMSFAASSLEKDPGPQGQRSVSYDVAQAGGELVSVAKVLDVTGQSHLTGVGLSLEELGGELGSGHESNALARRQADDLREIVDLLEEGSTGRPTTITPLRLLPHVWPAIYRLLHQAGLEFGPGWG